MRGQVQLENECLKPVIPLLTCTTQRTSVVDVFFETFPLATGDVQLSTEIARNSTHFDDGLVAGAKFVVR